MGAHTENGPAHGEMRPARLLYVALVNPPVFAPHEAGARCGARGQPGGCPAPRAGGSCAYGVTRLIRVAQLARAVRVPPQLPMAPLRYCDSVQVWAMYSDAIQIELPSVTAAP